MDVQRTDLNVGLTFGHYVWKSVTYLILLLGSLAFMTYVFAVVFVGHYQVTHMERQFCNFSNAKLAKNYHPHSKNSVQVFNVSCSIDNWHFQKCTVVHPPLGKHLVSEKECATFIGSLPYWPQGEVISECYFDGGSTCYMEPVTVWWWCILFVVSFLIFAQLFASICILVAKGCQIADSMPLLLQE